MRQIFCIHSAFIYTSSTSLLPACYFAKKPFLKNDFHTFPLSRGGCTLKHNIFFWHALLSRWKMSASIIFQLAISSYHFDRMEFMFTLRVSCPRVVCSRSTRPPGRRLDSRAEKTDAGSFPEMVRTAMQSALA